MQFGLVADWRWPSGLPTPRLPVRHLTTGGPSLGSLCCQRSAPDWPTHLASRLSAVVLYTQANGEPKTVQKIASLPGVTEETTSIPRVPELDVQAKWADMHEDNLRLRRHQHQSEILAIQHLTISQYSKVCYGIQGFSTDLVRPSQHKPAFGNTSPSTSPDTLTVSAGFRLTSRGHHRRSRLIGLPFGTGGRP